MSENNIIFSCGGALNKLQNNAQFDLKIHIFIQKNGFLVLVYNIINLRKTMIVY